MIEDNESVSEMMQMFSWMKDGKRTSTTAKREDWKPLLLNQTNGTWSPLTWTFLPWMAWWWRAKFAKSQYSTYYYVDGPWFRKRSSHRVGDGAVTMWRNLSTDLDRADQSLTPPQWVGWKTTPEASDATLMLWPIISKWTQKHGSLFKWQTHRWVDAEEFDLLYTLAKNSGKVFSREQLLELVWDYQYFGDERTVDAHIKKLRQK